MTLRSWDRRSPSLAVTCLARVVTVLALVAVTLAPAGPAGARRPSPANAPVAPSSATVGPAPTTAYVRAVSELFLDRAPTGSELSDWSWTVHRRGFDALTRRLATSDEWAGRRVDLLYRTVLGRGADSRGRAYWVERIADGLRLEDVAALFFAGDEYHRANGGTDTGFVDALYVDLLGREADPSGRRYWVDLLRSGRIDRLGVSTSFYASIESRTSRVRTEYRDVLDRRPDRSGERYWAEQLRSIGSVDLAAFLAASGEFHRRATGVTPPTVRTVAVGPGTSYPLSDSWRPGCPVGPSDLLAVEFDHWDYGGARRRGVLIVHRDVAGDVVAAARSMFGFRFPLRRALPVDNYSGDDDLSMGADNSSALNCRTVAGTTTWSEHAYGRAVDLNPERNPYVRGSSVDPPGGAAWLDRSDVRPGMVVEGGPVVATFDRLGWGWGGRWQSAKDHQHFSTSGR